MTTPTDPERQDALDACDVLNDFVGDFITSVMVFREYRIQHHQGQLSLEAMVPIQKMCLTNILLGLYKWEEFWKRYGRVVPDELRVVCRTLVRDISRKKVTTFRDQYAGHILSRATRRPITTAQIEEAFRQVAPDGPEEFFRWINDPEAGNPYPSTVVSICETVRGAIQARFQITPDEVMGRS